jgi:hypothetical protein
MRKISVVGLAVLLSLLLLLTACESYTQTGASTTSQQGMNGGELQTRIGKANGTSTEEIEVGGGAGLSLVADVLLTVGKGTFKIELLGADDEATLTLEARDGQTVSGQGEMVVDSLGEANFRVTATEAEDVEYTIVYTFR